MIKFRMLCRIVAILICAIMLGAVGLSVAGRALANQSPQEPFPDKKPAPGSSARTVGALGVAGQPVFEWPWAPGESHRWTSGPHHYNLSYALSGIDIGTGGGADIWQVRPIADGTVICAGDGKLGGALGNGVIIDHGTLPSAWGGGDGKHWYSLYAHMASSTVWPNQGEWVTRAKVLGTVGCSGNGCGGSLSNAHLHLDLQKTNALSVGDCSLKDLLFAEPWDGKVISGWKITSESNYRGHADRLGFDQLTARNGVANRTVSSGAVFSLPPPASNASDGCKTNTLAANDDLSTGAVSLPFTANFYGTNYTSLYVNNNGNVTFGSSLGSYTPSALSSLGRVIIAPFWADVDTRSSGSRVVTYGNTSYQGRPTFCVNWSNVGYFSMSDNLVNTFQLLLVGRADRAAGDFDIILNYDQVQWETGSHSTSGGVNGVGGNAARIGYSNGTPSGTYELTVPGTSYDSGETFAFLDYTSGGGIRNDGLIRSSKTSQANAGDYLDVKGRYVFAVRNGNAGRSPQCDQGGQYGYYGYLYDVYGVSYAYYAYTTSGTTNNYYAYIYLNAAHSYANSARQAFDAGRYVEAANGYYYAYLYSYYGYQFAIADYAATGNIYSYYTYLYAYTAANYDITGYSYILAYC